MNAHEWSRRRRAELERQELELEAGERPPLPACVRELLARLEAVKSPPARRDLRDADERRRAHDRLEAWHRRARRELELEWARAGDCSPA